MDNEHDLRRQATRPRQHVLHAMRGKRPPAPRREPPSRRKKPPVDEPPSREPDISDPRDPPPAGDPPPKQPPKKLSASAIIVYPVVWRDLLTDGAITGLCHEACPARSTRASAG